MSDIAIKVETLSKQYRLGQIGGGTLSGDLNRWWANIRGKPDPILKIGQENLANHNNNPYDEHIWALRDISFEVRQGEVLGIIGRNGAGKSTLLKILSRITAPTAGMAKLKGRVGSLLEVGTGFHPELTGRENIYLNGAILGMTRLEVDRKFDEIVDFSGVEIFIDTPVKRYSSGMYVRLAFAVAAHLDPEILLVDEVLAVGDAAFQKKCLGKMGEITKEGRTILFVSHNMAAITNLCPKAILLESGAILLIGPSNKTVDHYLKTNVVDLEFSSHLERIKKGNQFDLTNIKLLDGQFEEIEIIRTGHDLILALDYKSRYENGIPDAVIRISFSDIKGSPLFACMSRASSLTSMTLPKKGTIICKIPKFPLVPDEYLVGFWCKSHRTMLVNHENLFKIRVHSGDFFGTGRLPSSRGGPLLVEHTWDIVETKDE